MKKRFKVHIYAVVRVPVEVVAESPREAVKKADDSVSLYDLFNIGDCEYAEDIVDYLVDELDEGGDIVDSVVLKAGDVYK